jgi:hypothetical protein
MKRLSGWDAVLLYSETPNVHMHTTKVVAVIELAPDGTVRLFENACSAVDVSE